MSRLCAYTKTSRPIVCFTVKERGISLFSQCEMCTLETFNHVNMLRAIRTLFSPLLAEPVNRINARVAKCTEHVWVLLARATANPPVASAASRDPWNHISHRQCLLSESGCFFHLRRLFIYLFILSVATTMTPRRILGFF